LEAGDIPFRPPRGGGNKAFNWTAAHGNENACLGTQSGIAKQINSALKLGTGSRITKSARPDSFMSENSQWLGRYSHQGHRKLKCGKCHFPAMLLSENVP
jgi:hypothetical protein